jgi:hypothetical protein
MIIKALYKVRTVRQFHQQARANARQFCQMSGISL